MATRFYLPATGTAPYTPTPSGVWDVTTSFTSHPTDTAKTNTTQQPGTARQKGSTTAGTDRLDRIYVSSRQLAAQTIPVSTLTGVIRAVQSNAAADAFWNVVVRVMSADGTVQRGTVYAGTALTVVSATAGAENYEYPTTSATRTKAGSATTSVVAQDGDRIQIELGARTVGTVTTHTTQHRYGDSTATADFALTNDLTTDLCPWVELAATLTWLPPSGSGSSAWSFAGSGDGAAPVISPAGGSGSSAWSFAGAGDGSTARSGSASSLWSFAGSGDGTTTRSGSASSAWSFTGVGGGGAPRSGSASSLWSFTGTGSGGAPKSGGGTSAWSFAGAGGGTTTRSGSASSLWSFAGAGGGTTTRSGSASSAWSFAGQGAGTTSRSGDGEGLWGFAGQGTGSRESIGGGVDLWGFEGQGAGSRESVGDGVDLWGFEGTGEGGYNLPPLSQPVVGAFENDGISVGSFDESPAWTGSFDDDGAGTGIFEADGVAFGAFTSDGVGAGSFA